jgi:hypothetical protein
MTTPNVAGWYDDPESPSAQRYWDGETWAPQRRRKPTTAPPGSETTTPPPAPIRKRPSGDARAPAAFEEPPETVPPAKRKRANIMALLVGAVVILVVGPAVVFGIPALTNHPPAAPASIKSDVFVYNVSLKPGVAGQAADRLKAGGFNASVKGNLLLPGVTSTTVYFGAAPGEHENADAVGQLLRAPVEPRIREVADYPPGVIVVVSGSS